MIPTVSIRTLLLVGSLAGLAASLATSLVGCAAPPKAAPPPPPPPPPVVVTELPFEQAVAMATDALIAQTQTAMPRGMLHGIVVDPMLDAASGQQTRATQLLQTRVGERLAAQATAFELLPFQTASLARAQYLLTGTMTRVLAEGGEKGTDKSGAPPRRIHLALTDLKSGTVVAQSMWLSTADGIDDTPLPYYRDSPVLVKDKVIEGYIATTAARPGEAADQTYLERVAVATVINDATTLYNAEKYQEALAQYRIAVASPAGEQLRALNGIYLSNVKLGRNAEAEQAFGKVVALGIASNQLGVKFLFNPGTTDFWSDQKISSAYPMWLRQIAREANSAKACINIVGHTSRTGSEAVNQELSVRRATAIRQRLTREAGVLDKRSKASGVGFSENIVGSGTDNAVDALDRRVEFKIVPCS